MADTRPIDRLIAAYAALAGAALLFPHRPPGWPLLLALHAAVAVLLLRAVPGGPAGPAAGGPRRALRWRVVAVLRDWYPLLLMPLLYTELEVLNLAVWGGQYFDPVILRWEQALFGGQPSTTLAYRVHSLLVSEPLHLAYLSYYPIIYLPPLVLYLRRELEPFRAMLFALMLTFLVHYLVFVYFPVQGPRYLFPAPDGGLADGPAYRLTHRILETGSSRGSAFPSSHAGVAVAQTVAAFRYMPKAAPVMALATTGLGIGAVYGGFHYAVDILLGAAIGLLLALLAPRIRKAVR